MPGIWVAVKATTRVSGSSRKTVLKSWKSRPPAPMMTTVRMVTASLCGSRDVRRAVELPQLAGDQEPDLFGDVHGVVGGPLQLPAGVVQVHPPGQLVQRLAGGEHGGQQRAVQLGDPFVQRRQLLACLGVAGGEG